MKPRSIRMRLALATAGVLLLLGGAFGFASYAWLAGSLAQDTQAFALHEAQEIANVVASIATREELDSRRFLLDGLFPEQDVVGLALFALDGTLIRSVPDEPGAWSEPWPEGFEAARARRPVYAHVAPPGLPRSLRTAILVEYEREPRWIATAMVSEERAQAALAQYRRSFGVGLAVALGAGFLGCLVLLSSALRPLGRMVEDAARLVAEKPGGTLAEPPAGSELHELANLLNEMLKRDQRAFERLRQFTAHAGHELRTPLARIRADAELALAQSEAERQRECIGSVLEEIDELGRIIDALLELASGDDADFSGEAPFLLRPLLAELVEQARVVGDPRTVKLEAPPESEPISVRGSRVLLDRALWNLLDNAIKFGKPEGRIEVRLRWDDTRVEIEVADDGTGLADPGADELFEPFRRGAGQALTVTGHGLGLALSRAVVRRHAGDIATRRDAVLGGACFVVQLPRFVASNP